MRRNGPLLEARQLGRAAADGRPLLEDVALAIGPGERVALVGASGSGKTLLLRALAMLDPVDSGEVTWRGRAVAHRLVPRFRRKVVYLHQRSVLLGDTVQAALEVPFQLAAHRRRSFDPMRLLTWLAQFDRSEAFFSRRSSELSGGEIQLTALLRVLQLDPAVLLLDEPTAALDPKTAGAAEQLLVDWVAQRPAHRALVWVTHDEAQAKRIAQHIFRMHSGRIRGV